MSEDPGVQIMRYMGDGRLPLVDDEQADTWYYAVEQADGTHVHVGAGSNPSPAQAQRDRAIAIRQAQRRGGRAVFVEFFGKHDTGQRVMGQPVYGYHEKRVTPLAELPVVSR